MKAAREHACRCQAPVTLQSQLARLCSWHWPPLCLVALLLLAVKPTGPPIRRQPSPPPCPLLQLLHGRQPALQSAAHPGAAGTPASCTAPCLQHTHISLGH